MCIRDSSESSATPYINSVWGARSNREGANSALCAAITGYVPEYGLLLSENLSLIHIFLSDLLFRKRKKRMQEENEDEMS